MSPFCDVAERVACNNDSFPAELSHTAQYNYTHNVFLFNLVCFLGIYFITVFKTRMLHKV
jgi:hypothetical protein